MPAEKRKESWEQLEALLAEGDVDGLLAYLGALPPGETARALSRLACENRHRLLALLPPPQGAELLDELPPAQAAELLEALPPERTAAILGRQWRGSNRRGRNPPTPGAVSRRTARPADSGGNSAGVRRLVVRAPPPEG